MVSEHASPLAVLGGVDAGGQNVHVAELSAALADRGHHVTVYTRRDDASQPVRVPPASRRGRRARRCRARPSRPEGRAVPVHGDVRVGARRRVVPRPSRRGARALLDVGPRRARTR
ncbi:glycosyltransferase [Curtobacterium flaccumfaciens]|nr:glycosyltransferase [Curtobacterium flaccumfaciens]